MAFGTVKIVETDNYLESGLLKFWNAFLFLNYFKFSFNLCKPWK